MCDPQIMCDVPDECTLTGQCNSSSNGCGDNSGCCYQTVWTQPRPILPHGFSVQSLTPVKTEPLYSRLYTNSCGEEWGWPFQNLSTVKASVQNCTIQKLSYVPHSYAARNQQCENGSSYGMTEPILPSLGVCRPISPLDCCTVNKLSYMPLNMCLTPQTKPIPIPACQDVSWTNYC
ncbi:uncharacterized protein LOC119641653 [Glossina fuscipes]|uniref:Uncharacterized protein LOC119641653 n=1 Tax=Glossina fuscipes TaxID=7396 RepID=A0A9C6DY85_9MUSC|nr:uncharacterized protein LOC119641653 [Glossina fuscipes]KAI9577393.1 hypothetical protein GQX74_013636 [Glossina fuscipes]